MMNSRMPARPVGLRRRSLPLTKIEQETVKNQPVEKFSYTNGDLHAVLGNDDATHFGGEGSKFDKLLLARWNEAKKSGALQYDLNLLYKTLPGQFGLSAQLNMERATHRRKPHSFRTMNEPFDSRRFNFTKIRGDEILFELANSSSQPTSPPPVPPPPPPTTTITSTIVANPPTASGAMPTIIEGVAEEKPAAAVTTCHSVSSAITTPTPTVHAGLSNSQRSLIIVNNSPIEKGHSLLVPLIDNNLPQRITLDGLKLALECILLSSCRSFYIVYNSLLGHASVNQLHFHLYYWPYSSGIVTWPVKQVAGQLHMLDSWLIPGFVLQMRENDQPDTFARKVVAVTQYFHQKSVAHNIFMARAPDLSLLAKQPKEEEAVQAANLHVTVYLFPRKAVYGAKPTMNFTPAACECAGHLLIYTSTFFQAVHEARIVHIVEEEAYLEEGVFEQVTEELKKHNAFAPHKE